MINTPKGNIAQTVAINQANNTNLPADQLQDKGLLQWLGIDLVSDWDVNVNATPQTEQKWYQNTTNLLMIGGGVVVLIIIVMMFKKRKTIVKRVKSSYNNRFKKR